MRFRFFCVLLVAGLCFPACSLHKVSSTVPETSSGAQGLSAALTQRNDSLNTFKGLGKVKLLREGRSYSARVAWIGSLSGKIRVELVGKPGQPKTGFSSDGAWLYYYSQDSQEPVKKISTEDSTLKRFVSISIKTDEIVSLLAGRAPDFTYHTLRLERSKIGDGYILIREKKWWKGLQKVYVDKSKKDIEKIEAYAWNRLVYKAEFRKVQSIKGYRIPSRLVISNEQGDVFQLDIEQFWANASVSPDMFVLHPPAQ